MKPLAVPFHLLTSLLRTIFKLIGFLVGLSWKTVWFIIHRCLSSVTGALRGLLLGGKRR